MDWGAWGSSVTSMVSMVSMLCIDVSDPTRVGGRLVADVEIKKEKSVVRKGEKGKEYGWEEGNKGRCPTLLGKEAACRRKTCFTWNGRRWEDGSLGRGFTVWWYGGQDPSRKTKE